MRVTAFTGGKGGVGKTQTATRVAAGLAKQGYKVLLIDGDYSLANANLLLDVECQKGFAEIVYRGVSLQQAVTPVMTNLDLLAGLSGEQILLRDNPQRRWALERLLHEAKSEYAYVIIDTPAGVGDAHLELLAFADDILFLVCPGSASITDAYALIKLLLRQKCSARFHLVASMMERKSEAKDLYERFDRACQQYIQVPIYYRGFLPIDAKLLRGQSRAVDDLSGPYGRAISQLCAQMTHWPQRRTQAV